MFGVSKEYVESLRRLYPAGTRVRCNFMNDFQGVPSGTEGTVRSVDDMGTIHVRWDNGSSLGLTDEDSWNKI